MSRGAQAFRQGDVTKAIKAMVNAGLPVRRVEIEGGKIIVITGDSHGEPIKAAAAPGAGWEDAGQ